MQEASLSINDDLAGKNSYADTAVSQFCKTYELTVTKLNQGVYPGLDSGLSSTPFIIMIVHLFPYVL